MRHISPQEMSAMRGEIALARVIFRKPDSDAGAVIELLAQNGEEIMVSVAGTPDPYVFDTPSLRAFLDAVGLFDGSHDDVVLDGSHFRPEGFGRLRQKPVMRVGEFRLAADVPDEPEEPAESDLREQPEAFSTTVFVVDDSVSADEYSVDEIVYGPPDLIQPGHPVPQQRIGEQYLTTMNLFRATVATIVFELVLILMVPAAWVVRDVIYMCAGSLAVLAASFYLFERRMPDHPSLRVRRYIWLCMIVFNISLTLSYVFTTKVPAG